MCDVVHSIYPRDIACFGAACWMLCCIAGAAALCVVLVACLLVSLSFVSGTKRHTVSGYEGATLLEVAQDNEVNEIEGHEAAVAAAPAAPPATAMRMPCHG